MAVLNNSNAISPSGYDINNSLRTRSSASAYLSRTPASAGNRTTWTYSAWVKRGTFGSYQTLFAADTNSGAGATSSYVWFTTSDTLAISIAAGTYYLNSSSVYRDPSAWYHIVAVYDTTQATASNRLKLYVNGVQLTAFGTATYPTLNYTSNINNNVLHSINARVYQSPTIDTYFDGYVAEVNFIDGQALTPSSFGESDATTGVWKAKKYTGTYGTNGFYLNFSSIATTSGSNTGLGKDWSGNTNYWNTNNISVTSGSTYDAMTDSPTLTSATVANYATLNPVNTSITLSSANLNYSSPAGAPSPAYSTIGMTSGKWYYEYQVTSTNCFVGVWGNGNAAMTISYPAYYWDIGVGSAGALTLEKTSGTASGTLGNLTSNDVYGIALDIDNTTIYFYKNNTLVQTVTGMTFTGPLFFVCGSWTSASSATGNANFGQRPFAYTIPTGYKALNTYNLPDSTIKKGNSVMDASLYTGTGSALNVTNDASFKPDLVWIKGRSSAYNHALFDSVRGALKIIQANSTAAEVTETAGTSLTGFNSNGFALGTNGGTASTNVSGQTFVGWQWQAGQGSTSSGTGTGGITNVIQSVNSNAGFSVVTYTGSGAAGTITHGLGVAPKMIIIKNRSAVTSWYVYHIGIHSGVVPEQYYLNLDTATANLGATAAWNDTQPTSSVFSVGTLNSASTNNYVAYCWAEVAGFSKFGWYSGNGSTDGPFVYTGFRPKFVIWKSSSAATTSWCIHDTARNTYNVTNSTLSSNTSSADGSVGELLDILSNGFKIRSTDAWQNTNGGAYIFAAFAENPFKNALAR